LARTKKFDEGATLEKILNLFWQKGYHQATLADILLATGIKKQSMYNAYGDKRSVFIKVLRLYREKNSLAMTQYVNSSLKDKKTAIQMLHELFYINPEANGNIRGCLMINSMVEFKECDEEIRAEIDALLVFFEQILTQIVTIGQNSGELITTLSSSQIVDIFMNTHRGFQVAKDYDILSKDLNQIANSLIKLVSKN